MMDADLTVALIKATVQIDQPINEAKRMVGTGFLVSVPMPGGQTQTVLVTAAHVLEKMPQKDVRVGWRVPSAKGTWSYMPSTIAIRTPAGAPTYTQHPGQDIAVIPIKMPESIKDQVIPYSLLADEGTFEAMKVTAGQEMMTLGYPHGLSANVSGFPILRAGRLASYPVAPSATYPTFLIDLTAVPGNSGGPVFMKSATSKAGGFVAGVLIKQVEDENQRLELGVVTEAVFVRQTIDILLKAQAKGVAPVPALKVAPPTAKGTPGGATTDTSDMTGAGNSGTAGAAAKPITGEGLAETQ
ncbi:MULTISPECIES: serine protease [Asticcacaulis]|uniref:trypsin-like serine peptidase n=1 Tax=Asticcacaulis TaxID=76890 RepID=UPI001FDA1D54|nr:MULTISPECIES: serine protease [Asticcacaulis]MBP2158847.1 S1-C subfamily serine protease [Asticcacaulis solisilvae]MDR6799893.1 S1-C subfamily serine protease [Asticcacaulis sp. BE141]